MVRNLCKTIKLLNVFIKGLLFNKNNEYINGISIKNINDNKYFMLYNPTI